MPRPHHATPAGYCDHVLNRGNARQRVFQKDADYAAFLQLFDWPRSSLPLYLCAAGVVRSRPGPEGPRLGRIRCRPTDRCGLLSLRQSVERGVPYGGDRWQKKTVEVLGLESTLRGRGRPRNPENEA